MPSAPGFPTFEQLARNVFVGVGLGVDGNPAAGLSGGGREYLIGASQLVGDPVAASLLRWDGAAWEPLDSRPAIEWTFVPTHFPESKHRLRRCGDEYQQTVSGWETLLAPHDNTEPRP